MKKILIIADTSRLTGRELLSGAEKYISAFTRWEVYTLSPNYLTKDTSKKRRHLDLNSFDGFFVCYAEHIEPILKIKKPKIIHHTPKELLPGNSLIVTNSLKIGEMAAEYFVSLGFNNYAYCGFKNIAWSDERYCSYEQTLKKNGIDRVHRFVDTPLRNKEIDRQQLTRWLSKLPKPIGIFACNDDRAIYILEACKCRRIDVPEQVAVLGVDNDSLICNLSSPPLSSIALNFENTGYQAAMLLDQLMKRQTANKILQVDPVEIVARKSTDVLAIEDKDVILALQFIRKNFDKPIQVADVVNTTAVSRRELEYRFKNRLKRTIKNEIQRLRIEYIKKNLINSREPLYKIANMLEFTDPQHFSRYFKNQTGVTPSLFRQRLNLNA
jgi:LacI family transcriptional regulator